LLLPLFLSSQENWGYETSNRSFYPEYVSLGDPEWECSKLAYCIVPNKTKKFSEGRNNRDVKERIHEIEACCPHTRVDTRSDGTIGFNFEMGYQEKRIQDRKIYNWFSYPQFSWELNKLLFLKRKW
jgi:hypothetical protein